MRRLRSDHLIALAVVVLAVSILSSVVFYDISRDSYGVVYRGESIVAFSNGDVNWFIDGMISSEPLNAVMLEFSVRKIKPSTLKIFISSGGGRVIDTIKALEIMRSFNRTVAHVMSLAASGALIVFVNADERYMSKDAWLMWHSIQTGGAFVSKSTREFLLILQRKFNTMIKERTCMGDNDIDIEFGDEREFWIDHRKAKALCLVRE